MCGRLASVQQPTGMKHASLLATVLSLITYSAARAQSDPFVQLDTSALNYIWVGDGLPTADGGCVFQVPQAGGFSLWKCGADGEAQWRNQYPNEGSMTDWDVAPTASGDVLYVSSTSWQSTYMDTLVLAWDLRRIAQDGSVTWHKHFELDTLYSFYFSGMQHIRVVENAASELFVIFVTDLDWQNVTTVHKLSATGDLLWSRRVGDTEAMMSFPSPSSLFASTPYLVPDLSGGCRLVAPATDHSDESAYVMRLSADGELEWARLFDYLGTVSSFVMYTPAVIADGATLFITMTDSQNGGIHLVRISAGGDLLDVQRYDQGGYTGDLKYDQGALMVLNGNRVVTISETGDPLSAIGFTTFPDQEDSTYNFQVQRMDVAAGRVCFAGTFTATPTGAGLPLASPAISSFGLDTQTCGRVVFIPTGTHSALPNSIYTCDALPTIAADTIGVATTDASLAVEPRTLFGSTNLCVYTAVPEASHLAASFTVNRTLLNAGDALIATSTGTMNVILRDAKGGLVWQSPLSAQRVDVPTSGLASGLYMLVGSDVNGQALGTVKVAVQR